MRAVSLYVAGASKRNNIADSRGGWSALLKCDWKELVLSGHSLGSSAKRMELMATVEGLKKLGFPCAVEVVTSSQYICDCASRAKGWKANGWRNKNGCCVDNADLLKELYAQMLRHKCSFVKQDSPRVDDCKKVAQKETAKLVAPTPTGEDYKLMTLQESVKELSRRG